MKSTQVSTTNGTSCHMLKVGSKRRRTKAEIEADKLSETTSMREMREQLKKLQEAAAKQELESKANEKRLLKMADVIDENKKLTKSLELAKIKADEGSKSKQVIESLLSDGTLKMNEHGQLVKFLGDSQSRRSSQQFNV